VAAGEPADHRRFELARCRACGSAVTLGEPPGPDAYESGVYAPRPPRGRALIAPLQRVLDGQPARLLRRAGVGPGARVLDAGAGRGRLVEALGCGGFDASGIEPSRRGADSAAAAGRPVRRASIEEHSDAGLDAVVLWHVLEHLDDPLAALTRAAGWLRPGGVVLVGVPNIASLQAAIAGEGWLHLDAPRHRVHLTPAGLAALFGRAGLVAGEVEHMVWEHNPAAMWMALLSRLGMTPGFPFHLLKRNVPARPRDLALLGAGLALAPPAVVLEALAARAGRGGTLAGVAQLPR
jgi:SAM-dependent methyltransferase